MGHGNGKWWVPGNAGAGGSDGAQLRGGDQEGETAAVGQEAGGSGEDFRETLDGANGHKFEGGWGKSFSADILYIDVRKCKDTGELAKEAGFLVVRFNEGERNIWSPEFYGNAREASAGP